MPARPPYGFLYHLPRTLNKITEMGILPEKSEEDGKSDIRGFSLIESSSREVGSAGRTRMFEHGI